MGRLGANDRALAVEGVVDSGSPAADCGNLRVLPREPAHEDPFDDSPRISSFRPLLPPSMITAPTTLLLGSMPMAAPAATPSMPAWAVLAMAMFGALSLTVVLIAAARQEKARRIAVFEEWVRAAMPEESPEFASTATAVREGRGRPANLRRRRGGEWDTPIVPTITARPDRPERHRTRRV